MRYRFLILGTALALGALFLYYLAWRSRTSTAQASTPPVVKDAHPRTYQENRRHQPESGGPPTSSWPHTGTSVSKDDYDALMHEPLTLPIVGLRPSDIQDTYDQGRANGQPHEATDILAPRGTPVVAMVDGTIKKLFTSVPGGLTVYEYDAQEVYCYYYAHLDHYAEGLRDGMQVKRGTVIGYVGTTGNAPANTPHLHLAIFKLGPEKRWWQGEPINPYPILKRLAG